MTQESVDVAIIGGGPVGLSAAILLGHLGIPCALFERNPSTSFHPRGHVVSARTMEIFRQAGVEEEVAAAALPIERHAGIGFMTSLAGTEIGTLWTREDLKPGAEEIAVSPSLKRSCPQDVLEPILRRRAQAFPSADLRFNTEIADIQQTPDAVRLRWMAADGGTGTISARYVIAADGVRSFTREALGIATSGGPMGQQIGIYFKADLWPWIKDRPYLLWWIYNSTTTGVLISLDGRHRWTYNFGYGEGESRDDYTKERCEALIRAVIGVSDVAIDIQSIMPWRMQARIAERFQAGRVLLAGDACHPLPPTGGQGMNTGVADVHNLVWKLALVLRGAAPAALLETYEAERQPIGRFNVEQSARNAENMARSGLSGMLLNDSEVTSKIDGAEGAAIRERLAAAIPAQREHFDYPGQTFGYVYDSAIVVGDGTPAPPVSVHHYVPTARPGHRAPHFWLGKGAASVSSIDLFAYSGFTLLAGDNGRPWLKAFDRLAPRYGMEGAAYCIGPSSELVPKDCDWLGLYGILPSGAVLVRPDGHVAWRAHAAAPDPDKALEAALRIWIGLDMPSAVPERRAG